MAISEQSVTVAACDAPSCTHKVVAGPGEPLPGFNLTIQRIDADGTSTQTAIFAHSKSHVGPGVQAALRQMTGEGGTEGGDGGELDGPIVPERASDDPDGDEDGPGDDPDADDPNADDDTSEDNPDGILDDPDADEALDEVDETFATAAR